MREVDITVSCFHSILVGYYSARKTFAQFAFELASRMSYRNHLFYII